MTISNWQDALLTDTSAEYVQPFPPQLREPVEVSLLVRSGTPVKSAVLRTIENGIDHNHEMSAAPASGGRTRYSAGFELTQACIHYHFLLTDTHDQVWYFTRRGITSVYPDERSDFSLDTKSDTPNWVASSVFYQIFPDRFHSGDPELGVRDHEITRDGFRSREMKWTSRPLPYPDGGSLDFFNGDLPGVEAKLDYLQSIGVNALYLNPIFTAKTNHRYDCLDYFSVDPHLGGDDALVSLTRACHKRQMRIILDVSINHIGMEHAWAKGLDGAGGSTRVVVTREDGTPVNWMGVPELLKLDYRVGELRDRIYRDPDSLVQRYLRPPFEIDGWRFDVASETGNHELSQLGTMIWREIRQVVKGLSPQAYIVGEHWQDASIYLQGDQWDSAMNYFGAGRPVRMWLGEQDRFTVHPQREGVAGRPIGGDELAALILQHFTTLPGKLINTQFNLFDSHDVGRLHLDSFVSFEEYAGAVALLFFLPGAPCVYYGDEVGIGGNFDGDHGKRYPMLWEPGDQNERYLQLYRELATMKRTQTVLRAGTLRILHTGADEMVVARVLPGESLVLVLNRGPRRILHVPRGPAAGQHASTVAALGHTEAELHSNGDSFQIEVGDGRSAIVRLT